ncbi:hypothetical protein ACCUM_0409 [Candidatus Accumulibacter phosphatis]|uniref:Uncharacterized protein n=1 Tax=Candidatus Accumulibacter phosphatis TaxID=327160 RepID=A0A5S4EKB6_9PROT|nr:hypothetical protein ACCUM_0409 [Candidatus Accumulibacter phosphatis]
MQGFPRWPAAGGRACLVMIGLLSVSHHGLLRRLPLLIERAGYSLVAR